MSSRLCEAGFSGKLINAPELAVLIPAPMHRLWDWRVCTDTSAVFDVFVNPSPWSFWEIRLHLRQLFSGILGTRSSLLGVWLWLTLVRRSRASTLVCWQNCWPGRIYPTLWVPTWIFCATRPRPETTNPRSAITTRKT